MVNLLDAKREDRETQAPPDGNIHVRVVVNPEGQPGEASAATPSRWVGLNNLKILEEGHRRNTGKCGSAHVSHIVQPDGKRLKPRKSPARTHGHLPS